MMVYRTPFRTSTRFWWSLRLVTVGFILIINSHEHTKTASYSHRAFKPQIKEKQSLQKRRVLLWTQKRSGSQFSMHLLTALPSSFVMEEPLNDYKPEGGVPNITKFLRDILKCRFSLHLEYYDKWLGRIKQTSSEITNICNSELSLCTDPVLVEALCKASIVNVVKVVEEELATADHLLQNPHLDVRLVHLVRDPRALIASRLKTQRDFWPWVLGPGIYEADKNLTSVCSRYRQDLEAARSFLRRFPHRSLSRPRKTILSVYILPNTVIYHTYLYI